MISTEAFHAQKRWRHVKRILLLIIGIGVLAGVAIAYVFHWNWTGFTVSTGLDGQIIQSPKMLWDWLQLLVVPGVLAIAAFQFNLAANKNKDRVAQKRAEMKQAIALDKQREELLQDYLDRMSELLLKNRLRSADSNAEVRYIARARTLTVLYRLDADRKGSLIRFLYESGLIRKEDMGNFLDLSEADLSNVNLSGVTLADVNLSKANLAGAVLVNANLAEANLSGSNLVGADFSGANLMKAELYQAKMTDIRLNRANLREANLTKVDLRSADLSRANVTRTRFLEANLIDADFSYTTGLDEALYTEEQMEQARPHQELLNYRLS
jgi:uncharacterized protein YjbI with pentapeptide repeats